MASLRSQTTGNEAADASGVTLVAGDLIVVTLRERDGSTMAVSDSVNGAYTRALAAPITVGVAEIWYFRNSAGGTANFTVTGGSLRDYNVSVWIGMQTGAGTLDTTNSNTNSATTSHAHGSVTPSASALIVTALTCGTHGGFTPHSGFTALTAGPSGSGVDRQHYAYKLAHTGAVNPTHTSGNSITSDACCAAFLESGGGGGGGGHLGGGMGFVGLRPNAFAPGLAR